MAYNGFEEDDELLAERRTKLSEQRTQLALQRRRARGNTPVGSSQGSLRPPRTLTRNA